MTLLQVDNLAVDFQTYGGTVQQCAVCPSTSRVAKRSLLWANLVRQVGDRPGAHGSDSETAWQHSVGPGLV